MDKHIAPVNLATLPLDDAMLIARAGGVSFLSESNVVNEIRNDISMAWLSKHMPWACDDMTDEEFDARMAALHSAFHDGLDEAISSQPASKMKKSAGGHHE